MTHNKKIMAAILLLIAMTAMMLTGCASNNIASVSRNGEKELDLNEYVRVEVRGTDGYGEITDMYLDLDKIMLDCQEKINGWEYQILEEIENEGTTYAFTNGEASYVVHNSPSVFYARRDVLRDLIPHMNQDPYYELKDNRYLTNGTEIRVAWENDDKVKENIKILEDMLGLEIGFQDFTYTIDSLPAVVEVDPLENVSFFMEGNNGEARMVSLYADSYVPTLRGNQKTQIKVHIAEEDNHHLSNGDKVWVSLDGAVDAENTAREYGIQFTRTEGETEIRGLNAYGQPGAGSGDPVTVKLNDYLIINDWDKINGYGHLHMRIDFEAILIENPRSICENIAPEDMLYAATPASAAYNALTKYEPYRLISTSHAYKSNGSGLDLGDNFSNGEVIRISFEADRENLEILSKVMNIQFLYEDFEITVEGLREVREFDPFEEYDLNYEGGNGKATASGKIYYIGNPERPTQLYSMEYDVISQKNGALSNGDVIVLSVEDYYNKGCFLKNDGLIPTRTQKEVTVEGLR